MGVRARRRRGVCGPSGRRGAASFRFTSSRGETAPSATNHVCSDGDVLLTEANVRGIADGWRDSGWSRNTDRVGGREPVTRFCSARGLIAGGVL